MSVEGGLVDATALRSEVMGEIGGLFDLGVFAVDANLVVTSWNDWLERASGRAARDVVGTSLRDFIPPLRAPAIAAIERAVNGAVVVMSQALHEYLIDLRPPVGYEHMQRMQQSVRIFPRRDGSRGTATIFIEDVTERVSREEALRTAVQAAQAATVQRSRFFAAMSHELRTPIGAMSGYADLLANGIFGAVTETQAEQLRRIQSISSHLLHIVNEILSLARVDAGREEVSSADADAVSLAEEALIAVEPLAMAKKLTVRRRFPPAPVAMQTDRVKVRQILINLLGNAIKFTPRGSIELDVAISEDQRFAEFSVLDTGVGIAPADLARIFDPFTRVTGRERVQAGTGLGLAVSRALARLLGGDIVVTSEPGVGSRFTARIPRALTAAQ